MSVLQIKILNALKNNKFNPNKLGDRKWYNYFISIDELIWSRNLIDGYLIYIYSDEYKSEHIATYTLTFNYVENKDVLQVDYENID